MKKILAIALTAGAATLSIAPAAFADGAAGAVGVHLNEFGVATNIGAAGAIGDGTSFAGVALTSGVLDLQMFDSSSIDPIGGFENSNSDSAEISTAAMTNAVAINTDGDISLPALTGIGNDLSVTRTGLTTDTVGDGAVIIDAIVDVNVNTTTTLGLPGEVVVVPPFLP